MWNIFFSRCWVFANSGEMRWITSQLFGDAFSFLLFPANVSFSSDFHLIKQNVTVSIIRYVGKQWKSPVFALKCQTLSVQNKKMCFFFKFRNVFQLFSNLSVFDRLSSSLCRLWEFYCPWIPHSGASSTLPAGVKSVSLLPHPWM